MKIDSIKKAVEGGIDKGEMVVYVSYQQYQVLLALAEDYIKASDVLPKEWGNECDEPEKQQAVNDILHACRLVLLKKLEGIEEIITQLDKKADDEGFLCASAKELAEALKGAILK